MCKKVFVKEGSAGEKGTSFAEMNQTESSNAKKGPSVDYNSFKEFFQFQDYSSYFSSMDGIYWYVEH